MPVQKTVKFWQTELKMASRHEKKWRSRARKVVQVYRDEQDVADTRFNILWSNTQTQRPALYSSTPKPVIRRRHRQQGEVGRLVAQMLERSLTYALDPGGAYDFDRVAEKLILDYLLPGRMVARVKYHPIITSEVTTKLSDTEPDGIEFTIDESGKYLFEEKYDELVDEEVRCYHIPWQYYRQSVANSWDDVWWVAYGNNFLTREEIVEQFGEEHNNVPLTHIAHQEEQDGQPKDGEGTDREVKKAQVWELWDREDRKVYAFIEGYDKFLIDGKDDPLGLRGFFPGPEPALIVETPDSLIPIPEYTMYQYQATELNLITQRIDKLVEGMKLVGLYPGSQKNLLDKMFKAKENQLIPVEDWQAITERGGLSGMIEWIPLKDVADAWQRLTVYRQTLIQNIFELTGISDIQRGNTDPRETKGAQQIKASFASRRLLPKQQDTQRFFRDLFRIQAEIIAEHFDTDTIVKMAQLEPSPAVEQAREVMRDDALRSFTIDIETDSTIAPDEALEKQGVAEFTAAMSSMLQQIFPIVQAQPAAMGPLGKLILWMTRKFRIARDAEDEIEEFLQTFDQLPQQQDQAEQAKIAEMQAKQQMEMQKAQVDAQLKAAEMTAEIQRKNRESEAQIAREEAKAQLEQRKLLLDIAEKEAKIRLTQEEAEAKVVLQAVDQQQKRLQAESSQKNSNSENKKPSADISVDIGEAKKKRIKLIKDDKGNVEGAEVIPIEDKKTVKFNRDQDNRIESADVE